MDNEGGNKKRATGRQLTREDFNDDIQVGDGQGNFERASEEELKTRQIRRVRRMPATVADASTPNPFAGVSLTKPPTTEDEKPTESVPAVTTEVEKETKAEASEEPVKQGKESVEKEATEGSLFGSAKALSGQEVLQGPSSVDLSKFKPLDVITSGEEGETTVYAELAGLFINVDGDWKGVGRGEVKINVDKEGMARLLMRQRVTLKLLLNARLFPEMKMVKMGDDAVSFSCQNGVQIVEKSEDKTDEVKLSILALRFKTDAEQKVKSFLELAEKHKTATKAN